MSPRGIRTRIPNKRVAADPLLRLRGRWALAETFFIKYKTFANVDECFAMYITCEILVLK